RDTDGFADEMRDRRFFAGRSSYVIDIGERFGRVDGELAVDVSFAGAAPRGDGELSPRCHFWHRCQVLSRRRGDDARGSRWLPAQVDATGGTFSQTRGRPD